MKKTTMLIAGLTMLLATSGAIADMSPVGDPMEIGSWAQRFEESGVGNFDFMAVQWVSPTSDAFESLTFRNFSTGSWSIQENRSSSPTLAIATTGTPLSRVQFDIAFTGSSGTPLQFDFHAFLGNTWLESSRASWSGGVWSFSSIKPQPVSRSVLVAQVPVPGAMLLGFLGLGYAGMRLRKVA